LAKRGGPLARPFRFWSSGSVWVAYVPKKIRNAATLFRLTRSRGISLTTTDAIIAAIAVENGATIFWLDRDFARMARIAGFQLHQP